MRIITVSRQFGSGGRELGKRLADLLGWDYYDKEIIEALAEDQGMSPEHVRETHSRPGCRRHSAGASPFPRICLRRSSGQAETMHGL